MKKLLLLALLALPFPAFANGVQPSWTTGSSNKTENNWKKLFQKSRDEIKLYCLNFCKKYFNLEKLAE